VRYYKHFVENPSSYYIVMEYCSGGSLKDILKQKKKLNEKVYLSN
jgi:serine/threonine protein kinase